MIQGNKESIKIIKNRSPLRYIARKAYVAISNRQFTRIYVIFLIYTFLYIPDLHVTFHFQRFLATLYSTCPDIKEVLM